MSLSVSGWTNTSIIIIFDTNANPSAMLAICGWSGVAEITEENGHKWNANSLWATSGSPPSAQLGDLLVPTPLPCDSPRVLLGHRWLVLSSQQGHSPPIGLSLFAPMCGIHHLIWIYANVARILYQRKLPPPPCLFPSPVSSLSSHSFPFCLFLSAATSAACGNQLWRTRSALSQGFI